VHVNPGGEPERDDTGLPPVDIEIPDDARELDRDVQAYYRELRARRRHLRSKRFHGRLARDGMVLPLLVCCLIFALVTGTLLTLFTATSIDQGLPGASTAGGSPKTGSSPGQVSPRAGASPAHRSAGASPRASAAASPAVTPLPADLASATVSVPGQPTRAVGRLGVAVLLLVPPGCSSCSQAAGHLAALAQGQNAPTYLIATRSRLSEAKATASQIGQGLPTATDLSGLLDSPGLENGLTAILVSAHGSVVYEQMLQHNTDLGAVLARGGL
jgi:hypothetical protein